MGKLAVYILMMTGIILLMHLVGLVENTADSVMLEMILHPENINFNEPTSGTLVAVIVIAIQAVLAIGVIVIGTIARNTDFIISSSLIIPLFNFGWDFVSVFITLASISQALALIIFAPLLVLYIITVVEWWRGIDT